MVSSADVIWSGAHTIFYDGTSVMGGKNRSWNIAQGNKEFASTFPCCISGRSEGTNRAPVVYNKHGPASSADV